MMAGESLAFRKGSNMGEEEYKDQDIFSSS